MLTRKNSASLIMKLTSGHLYVQARDIVRNATHKFPGSLSFFGGDLRDGESAVDGFLREMKEEIVGLNFERMDFVHRVYRWKNDLERVDKEIDDAFDGNFNNFRGFGYDDLVPQEALGQDRGNDITFRELICSIDEDNYFITEVSPNEVNGLTIMEGKCGVLIPAQMCQWLMFYPTDRLALMHDIAMGQ